MPNRMSRALCCLCLLATATWAQSFLGSIYGTVLDPSGAVVPKANVVLTESGTGVQRHTTTNQAGEYVFADITPGRYSVMFSAPGFKELKSGEIVITGHQTSRFNARLEVGSITERVDVAATAPTLNAENAEIVGIQGRNELITAPTNLRSTIGLVMINSFNYQGEGSSYSLGGLRGNNTNFTIDGTMSNSNIFGAQSGPQTEVSFESLRDVKMMVSNNSAEFQNVATVFMETRSGENQVHGSLFYNQANGALNARSFFSDSRPPGFPQQHQFGGSFGGPVWFPKIYDGHNKTFFYFAFEQNRFPETDFYNASVPTAAFRSGDFSSLLPDTAIIDPTTGKPFAGNIIPPERISAVSTKVQDFFFRQPNLGPAASYVNNWGKYINVSDYTNRFSTRIDQRFSDKDNLSARFTARNDPEPFLPDNSQATTGHHQYRRNLNAYISEAHIFSPQLLNEFRVGFSRDHSDLNGVNDGGKLLAQFGILGNRPNTTSGAPEFDFANFDSTYEYPTYEWTSQALEILDNVTLSRGRHNLRMGSMIRRNDPNISDNPGCDYGCYSFDGSITGFDYADFLLGIPIYSARNYRAPNFYTRWNNIALYFQDGFRVSPKLTLDLGLRWEFNQGLHEKNNLMYIFDPASDGVVVPNATALNFVTPLYPKNIPIRTAQQAGYPSPSPFDSQWHDISPRISFAYTPFGRAFVLRGGYGIYYSPLVGTLAGYGTLQGGPFSLSEAFDNQIANGQPLFQFPYPFGNNGVATPSVDSFSRHLRTPYVQQWNITAERELKGNVVARATYRGFRSDQLAYSRNLNLPPASASGDLEYTYFPYPNFYKVYWTENGGVQKLVAMDLQVERKFASGLTFQSSYTLAKNQSDVGSDGERNTPEDPYNRARDFGNIDFMPRHRWVSYALWELPIGRGKTYFANLNRVVNGVIGGWSMSTILIEQTGQFLTATYGGKDILHNRNKSGRADCVGDPSVANQSIQDYYNKAAFAIPAPGMFGSCPVDNLTGPGINALNLGLQKNFHLTEKTQFQFRATASNALNHPLFSNPDTTITDGAFGQITKVLGQTSNRASVGAAGYRILTLGARIDF
jgi:hypothetical protein